MTIKRILIYTITAALLVAGLLLWPHYESGTDPQKSIKVALREVGNQLLLKNQDSSTLIKPVVVLSNYKYELSFENSLSIFPDDLVTSSALAFEQIKLPEAYVAEVFSCDNKEVAYSYKIDFKDQATLIPCSGRMLPKGCYSIQYTFDQEVFTAPQKRAYSPILGVLILILFLVFVHDQAATSTRNSLSLPKFNKGLAIGKFSFYPDQNSLNIGGKDIQLSKKECELLQLFAAQPDQVIKRETLSKRVWEDHGVVVGRSLDTYISKLRKILATDPKLKLVNVHGVGYKLETTRQ